MKKPPAILSVSLVLCLSTWICALAPLASCAAEPALGKTGEYQLFARTNLVAWCIVPFDARKRGPEARAAMLEKLGFKQFAYDYRVEHIPTFDAELEALGRHHVRLLAWWFPWTMNDEARLILEVFQRHNLRDLQLWVSGGGEPAKSEAEQKARIEHEAKRIRPIAEAAARVNYRVALYNHGGWFGEPENQIAIIELLKTQGCTNIGIVYNQHHGHDHLDRFPELLKKMKPYLLALNLNGMTREGEKLGKQILPLGQGDLDLKLLRIIKDSGWRGPIGILNHTNEDAEARLQDNLDGLDWLVAQIEGRPAIPKPTPRSWRGPS
jgi:sugar phosphate isomerase/epimerase